MREPRQIAVVRDYDGLIAAIRARVDELNVTGASIDEVAGLPIRYTAKLLGPIPAKAFGPISLGPMLQTLGLALIVVNDPNSANHSDRLTKRKRPPVMLTADEHDIVKFKLSRWRLKKLAKKATKARKLIPAWKRRSIARHAARARWRKALTRRAAKITKQLEAQ